jgi:hypothetical protein
VRSGIRNSIVFIERCCQMMLGHPENATMPMLINVKCSWDAEHQSITVSRIIGDDSIMVGGVGWGISKWGRVGRARSSCWEAASQPPLERHHSCLWPTIHPPPQFTRLPRQLAPLFFLISPFSFSPSDDCFPRKLYLRCSATSTELPPTTSTQAGGRKEKKRKLSRWHSTKF